MLRRLSTRLFWLLEAKTHFLRAKVKVRCLVIFQNVLSQKKLHFEMQKIEPKRADGFEELLQTQKHF